MKKQPGWFIPHRKSTLILALVAAGMALPASSQTFQLGPFEGNFSSNISVGASWRTEAADLGVLSPGNTDGRGRASSSTADDGNLNYDRGDMFSLQVRGIHDLELAADTYGMFTRVKYWYDHEVGTSDVPHGHAANGYQPNRKLDTSDFESLAQYSGIEFLDYYVYGSFQLGESPLELRAGNMVLSWGESTFIQNGVNVINPFDVTALRKPGSEIKEALLPVGMVYANYGLTYDLSVEGFVQYDWQRTILDECGTYWNAADPYGGGCDYLTISNAIPDGEAEAAGLILPRGADDEASDSGQWGLALRYYVEELNGTEFGLSAGVVTQSLKSAREFQRRARAGMVMVNLATAGVDYHLPFGGTKKSSYGPREQGFAAQEFYTQVKTTYTWV